MTLREPFPEGCGALEGASHTQDLTPGNWGSYFPPLQGAQSRLEGEASPTCGF